MRGRVPEFTEPETPIRPFELVNGSRLSKAQKNEARLFALQIVRDSDYREKLLQAARARKLPPAIESMLWHYAYGKPVERIEVNVGETDLQEMSSLQLAQRAQAIAAALQHLPDALLAAQKDTDEELALLKKRA